MLDLPFWKPIIYVLVKHAISKTITLFSKNLVLPWQSPSFPHIIHTFLLTKNHKPSFQFSHLFTFPTQPFSFLKTSENQAVLFFELFNFLTVNSVWSFKYGLVLVFDKSHIKTQTLLLNGHASILFWFNSFFAKASRCWFLHELEFREAVRVGSGIFAGRDGGFWLWQF